MTNQEVNEFMQRFLDDDLNEEELELLMEHIRQSPASAGLFERLQRLDSELESLPKVIPPMSIVDSILPRLELAGLIDHPPNKSATATDDLPARVVPMERKSTKRERVNYRLLGGVVAAGVVLTLFFSTFGPQMTFDIADDDAAATNQVMDSAIFTAEGNATFERSDSPTEPKSTGNNQEQATDSASEPERMFALTEPAPAELDVNSPTAKNSPAAESPSWVDDGSTQRMGAADSPIAMDSPAPSDVPMADNKMDTSPTPSSDASDTDASDMDNKASILNTPKMTSTTVASPDEQLSGMITTITEHSQQIIITDLSGQQMYESAIYEGSLSELTWSPDSTQLHFEVVVVNEPIVHMTIDLAASTESIKVQE